jgi:hypothetical protein
MSVISPELALIDPELAAAASATLHEPGQFRPASSARPTPAQVEPALRAPASGEQKRPEPVVVRPRARRRSRRVVLAGGASVVLATVALVVVSGVLGEQPSPPVVDEAAIRAQTQASARRDAAESRLYAWPAVPGASAYQLIVRRSGTTVFATVTSKPSLVVPTSLHLAPGRYTWSATPASANGIPLAGAEPVAEVTFLVSRPAS